MSKTTLSKHKIFDTTQTEGIHKSADLIEIFFLKKICKTPRSDCYYKNELIHELTALGEQNNAEVVIVHKLSIYQTYIMVQQHVHCSDKIF